MYKVLFVDDEPLVIRRLQVIIDWDRLGFTVLPGAYDSFEALNIIEQEHPELVFMDISMPEMDGLECIARAREMGEDSLFIILTGYAEFEYARRGIDLDIVSYLLKPYDEEMLLNAINKALSVLEKREKQTDHDLKTTGTVEKIMQIVDEQYAKDLKLSDLAAEFYIRPDYLCALFRHKTGMTFGSYLLKRRMKEAAHLLKSSELSISEVGERVGYHSAANFSRAFKRFYDEAPAKYKEKK